MSITPLPTAPAVTDTTSEFNTKAFNWVAALDTFTTETNALAVQVSEDAAAAAVAEDAKDAAIAAANFKGAWSGLTGALNIPASVSHNGAVWMLLSNVANVTTVTPGVSPVWLNLSIPDQTGNGGKVLGTDGTNLAWVSKGFTPETRTTNASITSADIGKIITYTSGGFTVALGTAASIGVGSQFAIKNNSSGNITLDPNGSELFDGQSTTVIYPGDFLWFICDGATFVTVKRTSTATFTLTSSQTLFIPSGLNLLEVKIVGGGGGGGGGNWTSSATRAGGGGGGGGGGGSVKTFINPQAGTATAVVGAAGTGGSVSIVGNGTAGGNSSFTIGASSLSATGGGGGVRGDVNISGSSQGGAGGTGTGGDTNYSGGAGGGTGYSGIIAASAGTGYSGGGGGGGAYHDGTSTILAGGTGGAGGSPYGGAGGAGSQSASVPGNVGNQYGGGGGGGTSRYNSGSGTIGGNGYSGIVYVRFG